MAFLSPIGGLLVLALVFAFCVSVAAVSGLDAALLPLPTLAGCVLVLLCAGYAGVVHLGLLLVYAALLAATVYCGFRAGKRALLNALCSPGVLFFGAAATFFWVLLGVLQPLFTQWDEFTFWGTAAKMLKEQNMLYPLAPGNLKARAGMPAMALISYLFQGLSPKFSEWQCLAGYDMLFMAALAPVAVVSSSPKNSKKHWPHALLLLGAGAVLPFFFGPVPVGTVSTVYANAMADVPLALLFGGTLCLYFCCKGWAGVLLTALPAALLTATKDMGFAYALIAVFVMFVDALFAAPAPQCLQQRPRALFMALLQALGRALPVLAVFVSWSRYAAAATGAAGGTSVGSAGLGMGQVLAGGLTQFIGIGRTEKFSQLMALMGRAFFTTKVCVVGGGALAVAAITAVGAAAFLLAGRGAPRRRVVLAWGGLGLSFAAFYLFHLILYYYNFSEVEALALKDYARYIGPYYAGWMLAMLCLLGRAAAAVEVPVAGRAAAVAAPLLVTAVCGCVLGLVAWRGVPVAGFWSNADSRYALRRDIKNRAAAANEVLNWNDRVLVISQGDDATRWYYYNYELTATVVRGFGGVFWGDDATNRWDSDFMNLVESENWTLYDYKAVCSLEGLQAYLQEKNCNYLLIDRSDDYLARDFSRGFVGGLAADMPATLYRVEGTGSAVTFVPVAESGVSQ
ncbi:MAG: hypothetical protein PHO10_06020 [Gemmiger sp.]|nr:hypothetical protein [Gemmiger sp.]